MLSKELPIPIFTFSYVTQLGIEPASLDKQGEHTTNTSGTPRWGAAAVFDTDNMKCDNDDRKLGIYATELQI